MGVRVLDGADERAELSVLGSFRSLHRQGPAQVHPRLRLQHVVPRSANRDMVSSRQGQRPLAKPLNRVVLRPHLADRPEADRS